MKMTARKAVDPIIATLLLIAIAVAAGIIVYVYVNSLAGGLTSGGGQQVSDQIAMDAYNFNNLGSAVVTLRDVGSTTVTISNIFIDGQPATYSGCGPALSPTNTCVATITLSPSATSGTAHLVKVLTTSGGTSVVTIIAGKTG